MRRELSQADSQRLARHFFVGFIRIHILHHAAEEPVCGVDLSTELTRHGYRLSPGTLYPILHALEADGYLRSSPHVQQGRRRRSYTITARGRWTLDQARKQIKELIKEVIVGEERR